MQTSKYVCTVGTVRSRFTILLVSVSVFKLACCMADNSASSLGPGRIVLQVVESRKGT